MILLSIAKLPISINASAKAGEKFTTICSPVVLIISPMINDENKPNAIKLNAVIKYSLGDKETPFLCKNDFIFPSSLVNNFTYECLRTLIVFIVYLVNEIYVITIIT